MKDNVAAGCFILIGIACASIGIGLRFGPWLGFLLAAVACLAIGFFGDEK